MANIHATSLVLGSKGILLTGASGSGKSDLALRMIKEKGAVLIADDRTDLSVIDNRLIASCPRAICGLLEVRGLGIISLPVQEQAEVVLVAELVADIKDIIRMPQSEVIELCGIPVKKIKLYPFEFSAVHKLALACDEN